MSGPAWAVSCPVIAVYMPSGADQAFQRSDYDHAVTLYQTELEKKPNDPVLTAGLVQVLLKQQKVKEADDVVQMAFAQNPQSAVLLTALGEVQYREGTPWLAAKSAADAAKIDICYPILHLLNARLLRLNSMYASAAREIATAHTLDPHNPRVRRSWLETQPVKERISELEDFLSTGWGDDPEATKNLNYYLDYLKQWISEPHKGCWLVSSTETATVPFAPMMRDGTHIGTFGLDVKFNDHNARLQIDTGASGLVINRAVANRAGLKPFSRFEIGGVGSEGRRSAYYAYADDIKIGPLEFRDCQVEVIDQGNVVDIDGLIGADVFSNFWITLDYPMRKLTLAPLPARPDQTAALKPRLDTSTEEDEIEVSPSTEKTDAPSSPASNQKTGPHDRYIAPQMKDWVPVYRIQHNLLIPASLNKKAQKIFILDTGAFSTTISPEIAREVTKVHTDSSVKVRGISGNVDQVYSADSVTFQFANVSQKVENVVAFATPQISTGLNMEVSGFIGFSALAQMKIEIDYRDGLIHFSYDPNRGYKFPQ
jgi:predicted aspartyl protease